MRIEKTFEIADSAGVTSVFTTATVEFALNADGTGSLFRYTDETHTVRTTGAVQTNADGLAAYVANRPHYVRAIKPGIAGAWRYVSVEIRDIVFDETTTPANDLPDPATLDDGRYIVKGDIDQGGNDWEYRIEDSAITFDGPINPAPLAIVIK